MFKAIKNQSDSIQEHRTRTSQDDLSLGSVL